MVDAAWSGAGDADIVVVLIDAAKGLKDDAERILGKLKGVKAPLVLALNKIDRVKKESLLDLARQLNERAAFTRTFMIAALTGYGVGDLRSYLAGAVAPGPWHYPEDEISDIPMRLLAAEITREKLYDRLHQELPYAATVETTDWKEQKGAVRIEQTIYVERESQRAIVLGQAGRMIKQLSMESRAELAEILEKPVHLFLFVKVREGWGDDPERYRELGLSFPKD